MSISMTEHKLDTAQDLIVSHVIEEFRKLRLQVHENDKIIARQAETIERLRDKLSRLEFPTELGAQP